MYSSISIIGGKGQMGTLFAKFFRARGFKVYISDLNTKLSNKEAVKKAELVMYAVPIAKTVTVIGETIPYLRNGQVVCDISSLKVNSLNAMLKSPKGVQVFGLHPMFGSKVLELRDKKIVFCKGRGVRAQQFFEGIFSAAGADIVAMSADEHDELMLAVQGTVRLGNLLSVQILRDLDLNLLGLKKLGLSGKSVIGLDDPVYQKSFALLSSILLQDPNLNSDLLCLNPGSKKLAKSLLSSAKLFAEVLSIEKSAKLKKLIQKNITYLKNKLS